MNDAYKTYVPVVGRLLLALMFILSGFGKLGNIEGTAAFIAGGGLPAPTFLAVAVGALELFGGLALVVGYQVRLAGLALLQVDGHGFGLARPLLSCGLYEARLGQLDDQPPLIRIGFGRPDRRDG